MALTVGGKAGDTNLRTGLQLSLRASAAAGVSVLIAHAARLEYPLYAMIGAVIVTELSAADTRRLGWSRLLGTLIGASVGAVMSQVVFARPITIAVGIAVAMFVAHAVGLATAARLAGYVSGIVLLAYHDQPWLYAWYRMLETVVGIGAAILVSLVPKLIQTGSRAVIAPVTSARD